MPKGFIPQHGGYKNLMSYQKTVIIYDATVYFCKRFYPNNKRQTDQMEQAARSGKQNIVEGSLASATSKQTEIFLTNVAKASLGELLEDYEDFLRINKLIIWQKEHSSAIYLTQLSRISEESYSTYACFIENKSPEISANTIRHLILQALFMLRRQIQRLESDFLTEGGIRERMTVARKQVLNASSKSSPSSLSSISPECPLCTKEMIRRTARTGNHAGQDFWGCPKYPQCKGIQSID